MFAQARFLNEEDGKSGLRKAFESRRPWLFLDRDGILIQDTGYPHRISDCHIEEEFIPIALAFQSQLWPVAIVTNQAGLAKNKFDIQDYEYFSSHLIKELEKCGFKTEHWEFCPFHPDGSNPKFTKNSVYRKPYPGMFLKFAEDHAIDFSHSIMIGDKDSDQPLYITMRTLFKRTRYPLTKQPVFETFCDLEEYVKENLKDPIHPQS